MLRNVFASIYEENSWKSVESRSGGGSEILRTLSVRENLVPLLKRYTTKTMMDAGCGDWNWMSRLNFDGIKVFACDIVPSMIAANQERFGEQAHFFVADITRTVFVSLDVILCRTVLFHLSLNNAMRALMNFRESGSRYLLATNHPKQDLNCDISDGGWRRLNLCLAPFNLPEPIETIKDGEDGYLGLWELDAI